MALLYYPRVGEIVICHYHKDALGAEMIKSRPVVVISPRLRRRDDLVGVLPLSTTAPTPVEDYHCQIALAQPLPAPFDSPVMWAKCDMYSSVSRQRLDRFKMRPPPHGGARTWVSGWLDEHQIEALRLALAKALELA